MTKNELERYNRQSEFLKMAEIEDKAVKLRQQLDKCRLQWEKQQSVLKNAGLLSEYCKKTGSAKGYTFGDIIA